MGDPGLGQEVSRCKGPKARRHLAVVRGEQGASVAKAAARPQQLAAGREARWEGWARMHRTAQQHAGHRLGGRVVS